MGHQSLGGATSRALLRRRGSARRWSALGHGLQRRRCRSTTWCKDVKIRFFVGGAEGEAFGTIVYNGAQQAAARHRRAGANMSSRAGSSRR